MDSNDASNAALAESTVISLTSAVPRNDGVDNRRSGERHMTLFRVGSFEIDGRRELCLIRNISAGGMMVRAYCDLQKDMRLVIELKSGQPIAGQVSWVRDQYSGIAFDEPIDVIDILSAGQEGPRPRMPRIEANCYASIRDDGVQHRARLRDISQGGAKLECAAELRGGTHVVASIAGLPAIAAVVCWSDGSHVGLSFNRVLPLSEMIDWLRSTRGPTALAG